MTGRRKGPRAIVVIGPVLMIFLAVTVEAQLPNPSAAALGMGENHVADAWGYSAVSTNPAGLAAPGKPASSFALMSLRGVGGLGPVGLAEIAEFDNGSVPDLVRRRWLDWIISEGTEHGSAGAEVTFLAAHLGRFGVQLSTTGHVVGEVGPGAAEIILFGNAGLTGEPADYAVTGGGLDVAVASTLALGYGHPIVLNEDRAISVGATLGFTVGHLMVTAEDAGSMLESDPLAISIDFPIAQTDTLPSLARLNQGTGLGLHLGGLWHEGPLRLAVSVRNVFNTFAWDEGTMFYRPGQAVLTQGEGSTDFDPQSFAAAPPRLKERVRDLRYAPVWSAGAAYDLRPDLALTSEIRGRIGDGQPIDGSFHAGAGVQYRPLEWLPLRAGAAVISEGFLVSGGLGLRLGVVRLDGAIAARRDEFGTGTLAMFTFSSESAN
ncbi:MAG: hypothetical protein GEU90_13250 [Gemmatimonas sp.]|nr:hypothetical protein [Gemmatimonas sp.]